MAGSAYLVLDTHADETRVVHDVLYWIMIDHPVTIDGEPVVVTPAAKLPWAAKRLECVQQRSGELDTGQALFVIGTVTAPLGVPDREVREYIARCLAERSVEILREYHRRYPEPLQPRQPQEPQAAVTQRPEPPPKSTPRHQCAVCGSEEAMVGRRGDATTCSDRCRQRAYRRRGATLAERREASHAA
jgi:hypothetical protein